MKKNKTLSLNKKHKTKKYEKIKESNNTLIELLDNIFIEKKNKNGEPIPASLSQKISKEIVTISKNEEIKQESLNKLLSKAKISDPNFKVIADLAILAIDRKSKMNESVRSSLMDFCTRAVSEYSILKNFEKNDVFEYITQGINDYLINLDKEINKKYKKRLDGLISIKNKRHENNIKKSEDLLKIDKKNLKMQRDNIIAVGSIYGVFNKKIEYKYIIEYFIHEFYNHSSSEDVDVSLYLIKNRANPEIKKSLFYIQQQLNSKKNEINSLQEQLKIKSREYSTLKESFATQNENLRKLEFHSDKQDLIIQDLKDQIKELGQEEKAKRVHLHDDSERIRNKAINLLEEDVLESVKLCLSVLRQDNPNAEMALDYIEIIEESTEKGLKWFKK